MLAAGKRFVREHNGKITQKDCNSTNGLPQMSVIYKFFGDMPTYQKAVGSVISKNNYVPPEKIETAVQEFFGDKERIVSSKLISLIFVSMSYSLLQ